MVKIENNTVIITLPIKPSMSKTGKSIIIAGTHGFMATTAVFDGKPVKISVNVIVEK